MEYHLRTSKQMELGRSHYLLSKEIGHHLNTMGTSVHVISKEEKVGRGQLWRHTPQDFLKADQVSEIAVQVTYRKQDSQEMMMQALAEK